MKAGRELNALIDAQIMDWAEPKAAECQYDAERKCWLQDGRRIRTATDGPMPDYSGTIAVAWDVVKKLRHDGCGFILNDTGGSYRARFWKHDASDGWDIFSWVHTPDSERTVWENTVPLAICLAALKAVGVEVYDG